MTAATKRAAEAHTLWFDEKYTTTLLATMSWRTIDIDQYDEDAYTEDEILADFESKLPPEQVTSLAQTRSTDVRNFLTK